MLAVGFARANITPPVGTAMGGHPGCKTSVGVLDDLFARAMVLQTDSALVAFGAVDILCISQSSYEKLRQRIAQTSGIAPENVFLCASHTHSGPLPASLFGSDSEAAYVQQMEEGILEAVVAAANDLKPAQVGFVETAAPGLAANARYIMKNGRVETHPWKGDADIQEAEGPVDDAVMAILIKDQTGKLMGGLVNYANHPQNLERENPYISADFPGVMERYIQSALGEEVTILFGLGCCGNICPVDPLQTDRVDVGERWMNHMGATLGKRVLADIDRVEYRSELPVLTKSEVLSIPIRDLPESKLQEAESWLAAHGDDPDRPLKVSNYGTEDRDCGSLSLEDYLQTDEWKRQEYRDVLALKERKDQASTVNAQISAVALGEGAVVMTPFEVFAELGMQIKQQSAFEKTLAIELANGYQGYLPTLKAFEREGGYETLTLRSSQLVPEATDMVVDEAVRLLASLKESLTHV